MFPQSRTTNPPPSFICAASLSAGKGWTGKLYTEGPQPNRDSNQELSCCFWQWKQWYDIFWWVERSFLKFKKSGSTLVQLVPKGMQIICGQKEVLLRQTAAVNDRVYCVWWSQIKLVYIVLNISLFGRPTQGQVQTGGGAWALLSRWKCKWVFVPREI